MADRRKKCPQCKRVVYILDTDAGRIWEMHTDRSGRRCGNSGKGAH